MTSLGLADNSQANGMVGWLQCLRQLSKIIVAKRAVAKAALEKAARDKQGSTAPWVCVAANGSHVDNRRHGHDCHWDLCDRAAG